MRRIKPKSYFTVQQKISNPEPWVYLKVVSCSFAFSVDRMRMFPTIYTFHSTGLPSAIESLYTGQVTFNLDTYALAFLLEGRNSFPANYTKTSHFSEEIFTSQLTKMNCDCNCFSSKTRRASDQFIRLRFEVTSALVLRLMCLGA